MGKKDLSDLPEGADSPLNSAVSARDGSAVQMATEAVKHRQCRLAYQPVMQARPPHGVAFYEGFIRVLDETGRVIPAREFMPQVENTPLGRDLDCVALEKGLRAMARNPDIRLAINMSARSIGYARWSRVLERFLKRDPTIGERLILEISEDSAMQVPELVIDFMDRLQDKGVAFTLDDFGASNFSFRHFREFFFDAAKIDGQFVRGISTNPDNQALVRALIAVAREFEILVIAESVETREDAEFLVASGVDCLQGFLFGAPSVKPPWEQESAEKTAS
ncbi:EAL domain, c-di-GMP-specific phosphodiesterase class I (or its enzymatically inactive variant) [Ruegeria intermedia]|uniref:EAL domain, c-di-GMP-specific phosphodiesterase class I (Or its enzymatically inactive variant) n=1 Tax=Ruegeria intermedia TaxID=996115 RepID=A0A1M5AFA1_9RHOB|nr:EAL domain-containing protein [Ruegeria intermedia]SHF28929.1 EAL domain, c-di-GMP-specific phosphodiesterase class I (or its enzymatically inactive variant) [Ruegeria intermedia]